MFQSKLAIATILTISSMFLTQITRADDRQSDDIVDCQKLDKNIKITHNKIKSKLELFDQLNNTPNQLSPDFIKDQSREALEDIESLNTTLDGYLDIQSQNSCNNKDQE